MYQKVVHILQLVACAPYLADKESSGYVDQRNVKF